MKRFVNQVRSTQAARFAWLALAGALLITPKMGIAQDDTTVLKAYESKAENDADFNAIFDFIKTSETEEKWRQIDWIPGLWTGVEIASEKQKPVFIWAMNGDPLGCV